MSHILDIHTHHLAPQPEGVVSVEPEVFSEVPGQLWSVGLHPWGLGTGDPEARFATVEALAMRPEVVAVGETGIDLLRLDEAPLFLQLNMLRRHVELSERVGKPLILHSVRAQDIICSLRRELKPRQEWVIHGFRGKPTIAQMYLAAGCFLSFGERFNEESLRMTPPECLLAETDESTLSIAEIISHISEIRCEDMGDIVASNTAKLLTLR